MKLATQLPEVVPHLFHWTGFHTQWKVAFDSFAVQTPAGVVLVDPIKPPPAVIKKIDQLGEPLAVILTNANHDREADWFRKRYQIQVYAHEQAAIDCDTRIDVLVVDGEKLPGAIKAIYLPGAAAGEIALYANLAGGTLLMGDVLVNPTGKGLALLPDQYLADRKCALQSLRRLLDLRFKNVTFAHGAPIVGDAKRQITAFLKKPKK